jgi:hypothetical protein
MCLAQTLVVQAGYYLDEQKQGAPTRAGTRKPPRKSRKAA